MPMQTQAVLLTKKATDSEFNTDSVNASSKTWPRETVHGENGIRACGSFSGAPYFVIASSEVKGTAEGAADLFNTCKNALTAGQKGISEILTNFLNAFANVINKQQLETADYELGIFAGKGSEAVIARSGDTKLYTYFDGKLAEVTGQECVYADETSSFGIYSFPFVKVNDIFLMLTSDVAKAVPENLLLAICKKCGGDLKNIAKLIMQQAQVRGCTQAVTIAAIKIEETDAADNTVALSADASDDSEEAVAENGEYSEYTEEEAETAVEEDAEAEVYPEPQPRKAKQPENTEAIEKEETSKKGIFAAVFAIFVILIFMVTVLTIYGIKNYRTRKGLDVLTTAQTTTLLDESTWESTTEPESTTEEESTTEAESTNQELTTKAPETTRKTETTTKKPETTTRKQESTTKTPTSDPAVRR